MKWVGHEHKVKSFEDAMKLMEALDLKTKEYKVELERDE